MVVCFVKIHIRPYMDDIFTLIRVSCLFKNKAPFHSLFFHSLRKQLRTLNCVHFSLDFPLWL